MVKRKKLFAISDLFSPGADLFNIWTHKLLTYEGKENLYKMVEIIYNVHIVSYFSFKVAIYK